MARSPSSASPTTLYLLGGSEHLDDTLPGLALIAGYDNPIAGASLVAPTSTEDRQSGRS